MPSLLMEMGYRAVPELQSRAVSVIQLDVEEGKKGTPSPQPETEKPVCTHVAAEWLHWQI